MWLWRGSAEPEPEPAPAPPPAATMKPKLDWRRVASQASEKQAQDPAAAADVLWRAVERQIPDVRERAKVTLVGTPLTHERFLRRDGGTYGPFLAATDGMLGGQKTALDGFLCCGDSTFPGIGMPAAAASGLIAANSVVSVAEHWKMLDKIRF